MSKDCVHSVGSDYEKAWFFARGVDCMRLAKDLWDNRHSIEEMERIVMTHRGTIDG